MEQLPPGSPIEIDPDSSATTPVTPTFPTGPDPVVFTEIELARHHVNTSRDLTESLMTKLAWIHERLSSDMGFQHEEDNLAALRKWADDSHNVASEVWRKAARLVDDIDYLVVKLGEEKHDGEASKSSEKMQVDEESEKKNQMRDSGSSKDAKERT